MIFSPCELKTQNIFKRFLLRDDLCSWWLCSWRVEMSNELSLPFVVYNIVLVFRVRQCTMGGHVWCGGEWPQKLEIMGHSQRLLVTDGWPWPFLRWRQLFKLASMLKKSEKNIQHNDFEKARLPEDCAPGFDCWSSVPLCVRAAHYARVWRLSNTSSALASSYDGQITNEGGREETQSQTKLQWPGPASQVWEGPTFSRIAWWMYGKRWKIEASCLFRLEIIVHNILLFATFIHKSIAGWDLT